MELRHLRYFCAVAERQNFTEAARHLRIAQPPLSVQIRHLEAELGVPLFERRNRRAVLTPAGRLFWAEAQEILTRTDAALQRVQDEVAGRAGEIRLAYSEAAFSETLTRRLRKFVRKNRGLRVSVQRSSTEADLRIFSALKEDRIAGDVELETGALLLAVPPKHRLADRAEVHLADLLGEPVLMPRVADRSPPDRLGLAGAERAGVRLMVVETPEDRFWRVSVGLGVTFCSSQDRATLDAVRLPLPEIDARILTLARPNPNSRAAAIPRLLEALTEASKRDPDAPPKR